MRSEEVMYFVPLSQLESVELLIHCLKAAAGETDCSMCPVRKVCMQQCLTIAGSVEKMLMAGTLPQLGDDKEDIERKTQRLTEASGKIAEKAYAQEGAADGAAAESTAEAGSEADKDDDVVDAEFEEVDEKKA